MPYKPEDFVQPTDNALKPTPVQTAVSESAPSITPTKVTFFNDPNKAKLRKGLKIAAFVAVLLAISAALVTLCIFSPGVGLLPILAVGMKASSVGAASTVFAHTALAGTAAATTKAGLFAASSQMAIQVSTGKALGIIAGLVALLAFFGVVSGCKDGRSPQFND